MRMLRARIEEDRLHAFLALAAERSGEDPRREVASGRLGEELDMPYEYTLRIVGDLTRRGWLDSSGVLAPPAGPMVRVTRRGLAAAGRRAA